MIRKITVNGKQLGKEDIYLDLSKLSEHLRKDIRNTLREKLHSENIYFLPDYKDKPYLFFYASKWDLYNHTSINRTEINYSQFLELISETKQPKYRFKTLEEFDKEFKKDRLGDYITGKLYFVKDMFHLAGVPIPDEFSKKIMNSPCGIWLNLEGIIEGKDNCWVFTPEMLTLNEQENSQSGISQEKIDAFKNGEWFIRGGEDLEKYFKEKKYQYIGGHKKEYGYSLSNIRWYCKYTGEFSDCTELKVPEYKQLSEMLVSAENAQVESDEYVNKKLYEAKELLLNYNYSVIDNDDLEEFAEGFLKTIGKFVFPKAPEGDFPDLSDFEAPIMDVEIGSFWYKNKKVFCKIRGSIFADQDGRKITTYSAVRPIQPELTPEEIVEKLGKDYLLKLIKEK